MARTGGFADRLYRGEANLNIIGRRRQWFLISALLTLVAIGSFIFRGFELGIEFEGGTAFNVPATAQGRELTQTEIQDGVSRAVESVAPEAHVGAAQKVGRAGGGQQFYTIRASTMTPQQAADAKAAIVQDLKVDATQVSDSQVSAAWGGAVTRQALIGLGVFLVLVMGYLVIRFEWRMAVAAVSSLLLDLVLTAGVYSLIGFEVTPSTVIGFLTILGFSLYDVVVVFDKVQENTRGITAGSTQTYGEATNLAVNQTLMRSINTGLVALLPVGGLLFIGAGLLGAGTLKDLGLVLFVGMGIGVAASILFAAPLLSWLKDQEPRIKAHNARVMSRRSAARTEGAAKRAEGASDEAAPALAGSSPRPGARPAAKRNSRGGRPGASGNRPGGGGKRR
ncbi:protein translocase subunit secF [Krasilnikovia cinnamomea]|uniref:Protein-export membrane protein SecF n=1 Tax=Krasilnikovia cinnamomea TaxID=349313 RepID=A0A4Q7ZFT8_9ACTN|nr:protein translocase subunit SecF [Krasilnikovia cinnamomea]RZU49003.1 protein translocase subunit secF [Krasilnikovia cinnamomea]